MKHLIRKYGKSGLLATLLAATLFSVWTIAFAEDFSKRFYINGGIGLTHVEPESSTDALQITDNEDSGGHLAIGFDVNRFLTVEAYGADLGQAEVEFLGTPAGNVGYQTYGISALGYLLNSRSGLSLGDDDIDGLFRREGASLYGRVGWGHMINDPEIVNSNRDYTNHAAFGLGVEYGFSNGFALRSELMTFDTDAKYWNIGILKRFGSASGPLAAAALPAVPVVTAPQESADVQPKEVVPAEPKVFKPIVPPTVYFDFDSYELSGESLEALSGFASAIQQNDLKIEVQGHADWIATESYNMTLSERRAEVVADYLVDRGVSPSRLTTIGYGETRPISSNNTAEGRALNRRTQIQLR